MLLPQEGHPKASAIDASLQPSDTSRPPITLVIHGGAGNASPSGRDEAAYRHGMRLALAKGYAVLERGGSALDAVTVAVSAMEDDENFNAGRGAVFNSHGNIEMEASIMTSKPPRATERNRQDEKDASTLDARPASIGDTSLLPDVWQSVPDHRRCMSATLLRHARNPIQLVRALYLNPEDAPHPYLSSSEAEVLGFKLHGSRPAPPSYFWTRRRWLEHRRGLGLPDDLSYPVEPAQEVDISSLRGDAQGGQHLGVPPPSYSEQTPSLYQSSDAQSHKRSSFESSASSDGPQTPSSSERGDPSDSRGQEHRTSTEVNEEAEDFDPASLPQGTVGAVALDTHGTVACATSTGGKTNKMQGRIGDTCTPGAGFWAEEWTARASAEASQTSGPISTLQTSSDRSMLAESISSGSAVSTRSWAAVIRRVFCCRSVDVEEDLERSPPSTASQKLRSAQPSPTPTLVAHRNTPSAQRRGLAVSGTGDGDYFLRLSAASHLAHRAQFLGESLSTAAQKTVEALGDIGGVGGFIGVDTDGQVTFALNSTTLNRGYMSSVDGAVPKTAIWADDQWE